MGISTNAPQVTAQSRIRGSKFTGMVVLSLLPKTPREQTPSTSAVTTGQVFTYSSCFKKNTQPIAHISVQVHHYQRVFWIILSSLPYSLPPHPRWEHCTSLCARRYMGMTRGRWIKSCYAEERLERGEWKPVFLSLVWKGRAVNVLKCNEDIHLFLLLLGIVHVFPWVCKAPLTVAPSKSLLVQVLSHPQCQW